MPTSPDARPHRSFPREGFTLFFDPDGIEIRVDDYHPLPLKLTWPMINQMRVVGECGSAWGRYAAFAWAAIRRLMGQPSE